MTDYSDYTLQDQITASGAVLQDHLDNHPSGEVSLAQLTTTSGDIISYVDQEVSTLPSIVSTELDYYRVDMEGVHILVGTVPGYDSSYNYDDGDALLNFTIPPGKWILDYTAPITFVHTATGWCRVILYIEDGFTVVSGTESYVGSLGTIAADRQFTTSRSSTLVELGSDTTFTLRGAYFSVETVATAECRGTYGDVPNTSNASFFMQATRIDNITTAPTIVTVSGSDALSFSVSYDDTFPKYLFDLAPTSFISRVNFVTETVFSGVVDETDTLSTPGVANGGGDNTFIDKYSSIPHGSLVTRFKIYSESSNGIILKIGINYPEGSTAWDIYTVGSGNHTGSGWEYLELDRPFVIPNYGYTFPGYYSVNGGVLTNNSQTPTTADDYFNGDVEGKKLFRAGQSSYQRLITAEYTTNEYVLKGGASKSLYIADQIHPVHHINDLTGSGTGLRPLEYYNNVLSTTENIPIYLDRVGDVNTAGAGTLYVNVGFPESSASTGGVSSTTDGIAAESLPQYRMIYADSTASGYLGLGEYNQTEAKANVFGMVTQNGGISVSGTGEITLLGKITNPAWNWNPNADLWLSSSGTLTETKPTADSVYAIPCGHSLLDPTEIWLSIKTGWKIGASNISAAGPLVRGAVEGRFDHNSDTELIWTPVNGNGIGLWNGYEWRLVTPATDITAANTATTLSGVSLAVDSLYDVFAEYVSDDEFQFVFKHWDGATAGSSDRGYSLYQHQGVYVEANTSDGKKRRWLGTLYMDDDSGAKFKDDLHSRYVANYYNRNLKSVGASNSTDEWDYSTGSYRELNNGTGMLRGYFIALETTGHKVSGQITTSALGAGSKARYSLGLNGSELHPQAYVVHDGSGNRSSSALETIVTPTVGLNYISMYETGYADGGGIRVLGYDSSGQGMGSQYNGASMDIAL